MSADEKALLARYRGTRDAEAFHEIVLRHEHMVYATCRRILGNAADAEDAAQTCFLTLARRPERVRRSLAGWLHRVAVGTAIDLLRQDRARRTLEGKAMQGRPLPDMGSWDDLAPAIDEAIDHLPDDLRIPVVRHFLEGRTQEEIGQELGITHSAVSKRLQRATLALRKRLVRAGLTLSAAVIASLLSAHATEAAPATLQATLGKMALASLARGGRWAMPRAPFGAIQHPTVLLILVAVLLGALLFTVQRPAHTEATGAPPPSAQAAALDYAGVTFWAMGLTEARAAELRRLAKPLKLKSTGKWDAQELGDTTALQCSAPALLALARSGLNAADVVVSDKVQFLREMPSHGPIPIERFGDTNRIRLLSFAQAYNTTVADERVWGSFGMGGGYWLKSGSTGTRLRLRIKNGQLTVEHTGVLPPGSCWLLLTRTGPGVSQGVPWHVYVVQTLVMTPMLEKVLARRIGPMGLVDSDAYLKLLSPPNPTAPSD